MPLAEPHLERLERRCRTTAVHVLFALQLVAHTVRDGQDGALRVGCGLVSGNTLQPLSLHSGWRGRSHRAAGNGLR